MTHLPPSDQIPPPSHTLPIRSLLTKPSGQLGPGQHQTPLKNRAKEQTKDNILTSALLQSARPMKVEQALLTTSSRNQMEQRRG